MDQILKLVVDLDVLDRRETEGVSTRMEKEGLVRLLLKLSHEISISEITTDASKSVIKALREMKKDHPQLSSLVHSLDTWHKAKSLRKALSAAAKSKEGEALAEWVEPIINHFWHCSQSCGADPEKLKDMWLGVLHHVCGEHTGHIENFNSMMLKYAPKRNAFEYQYYTDRMYLAAVDHNVHIFREKMKSKRTGNQIVAKKLHKRSKNWHVQPLKSPKEYPHIPKIMSKIVQRRKAFKDPLPPLATKLENDPRLISPTLGGIPPSTESLVKEHVSRINKTSK
ncbi:uncharacterized protein [Clytia hemisphaerica]|uniref:uncharacterized protein n=1 Tax=Clytia hemisphaerica TaxID=252671 RepID=UPI0034D4D3BD